MLHQILIVLFFQISTLKQLQSVDLKPFHCDSEAKIDEIKNFKNLKRLIRDGENVYFVYKNRVIFGKLPILFERHENYIDKNDLNKHFFTNHNFYEKETEEIDLPMQVVGHFHDLEQNQTREFYVEIKEQKDEIIESSKLLDKCYELDFKGKIPAKRKKIVKNKLDIEPKTFDLKGFIGYFDSIKLTDRFDETNGNVYYFFTRFQFTNRSISSTDNYIEFYFFYRKLSPYINHPFYFEYHCRITDLQSQMFIATYSIKNYFLNRLFFLGLDQISSKIILADFQLSLSNEEDQFNLIKVDYQFRVKYDFDELFR